MMQKTKGGRRPLAPKVVAPRQRFSATPTAGAPAPATPPVGFDSEVCCG